MTIRVLSTYIKKNGRRDALLWSVLMLLLIYSYFASDTAEREQMTLTSLVHTVLLNLALPIYLHNCIWVRWFDRKRYFLYGLLVLCCSLLLGGVDYWLNKAALSVNSDQITYFDSVFSMVFMQGLALAVLLSYRYFIRGREVLEYQVKLREMELSTLKAQVNPHFLFNTLHGLYVQIVEKTGSPADQVLHLSELMRYQLQAGKSGKMPLEGEIAHLRHYLALEQMRWGESLDLQITIESGNKDHSIEPLLLLPFVENIFKHGVEPLGGHCNVMIHLGVQQHTLYAIFENNMPIPARSNPFNSGHGLANVRRRLELAYPEAHLLEIEQDTDKALYLVKLSIDL
jgi:two-component system, LytTR family, sensor kinase